MKCGNPLAETALACPACKQMVHAEKLEQLAAEARSREVAGDIASALSSWKLALELLPAEAAQAIAIRDHISTLGAQLTLAQTNARAQPKTDWKKRFGPLGVVIAILVKFKSVVLLALTKAKFLIFGLTKLKTILSMLAFLGVYWGLYGWKWALGFVVAIYIHEMGHVWALKQFGLRASSPMFIPFFGALVSLYESPANVGQDARIGLAGPIWGTGAAIAFALPALVTHDGIWLAIAHTAAYLNLFNLLPVWQLDGGRGFRALDKQQRLMLLGLMLVLWYLSGSGLLLILSLGALYRIFLAKDFAPEPDQGAFVQFAGLLTMLGGLLYLIGDSYLR